MAKIKLPNQRGVQNVIAHHKAHKNNPNKFKPVDNHPVWSEEVTLSKMAEIKEDIAEFNREIQAIDSEMIVLVDKREALKVKLSRKWKYLKQLEDQMWNEL